VNTKVDALQRDCAISVLGGPTTVVDIAGRRIVMDPTFDPPGVHAYLTKLAGPAVSAEALGVVDAVLISHDQHPDNLDDDGRGWRWPHRWFSPIPAPPAG
jgi:L-ascorbate metabolism protein UlaG (beta-lactamase superfamily)